MEIDGKTVYCSLDLEMSGFDPEVDEILEIGFVFFTIDETGAHPFEEWTKVFRPTQPVHPKILGLTGISQTELERAPLISEHKQFLQEKLENVVIVGHSIKVDIAFLESAGLTFHGGSVDTLELAQFILPTHHSYNLENLIHTFSIVSAESHRALADAQATMALLEKLLGVYQGFPKDVHSEINKVLRSHSFIWKDLLSVALPSVEMLQSLQKALPSTEIESDFGKKLQPKTVVSVPLSYLEPQTMAAALQKTKQKHLWVVADKQSAIAAWKSGLAQVLLPAEDYFDEKKFKQLLKRDDLSPEEARFVIKVLVWLGINWQTYSIVDLNISFFGGQFRHLIAADEIPKLESAPLYITDYETFLKSAVPHQKDYTVIFERMADLERIVSKSVAKKASWGFGLFALKSIYNPEAEIGDPRFKEIVVDLLTRVDLFFGICQLQLQAISKQYGFVTDEQLNVHDYEYNRMRLAADSLLEKLEPVAQQVPTQYLNDFVVNLRSFFYDQTPNAVRYVEFREGYVSFISQPLQINAVIGEVLEKYEHKAIFIDTKTSDVVEKYYTKRLGIEDYDRIRIDESEQNLKPVTLFTQDLSKLQLFEGLSVERLPLIISFPGLSEIKEFYREYHEQLNELGVVYAQGYSGGTNKIVRNFGIRPHSILMVTHEFLSQAPLRALRPKQLIIANFASAQDSNHPYIQALSRYYDNELGVKLAIVRSLQVFESLLKRVYQQNLEQVELFTNATDGLLLSAYLDSSGLYQASSSNS